MRDTVNNKLWSFLLLSMILLLGCGNDKEVNEVKVASEERKIQRVEVTLPQHRSFVAELLITGTAEPNREVMIHAMESGIVNAVYKDIGDLVSKGGVIAQLDNPELHRKKQQLSAEVEAKRSVYERLNNAYQKTPAITPVQMLENAKAEFLSMQAQLDAINDRIYFFKVRAPFTGIITQRFADEGMMVQSGINNPNAMALFELQDMNPIRLSIPVPEADAMLIKIGMEATISFPELPGASFISKISRTSGSLDPKSKTMKVEIDIPNADHKIKPGMYAKVLMNLGSRKEVLSLPVTAQLIKQNQPVVLAISNGKVEQIALRKGLASKDYFEVLNSEITDKTQIIVQGKGLVKPGELVEPVLKAN